MSSPTFEQSLADTSRARPPRTSEDAATEDWVVNVIAVVVLLVLAACDLLVNLP